MIVWRVYIVLLMLGAASLGCSLGGGSLVPTISATVSAPTILAVQPTITAQLPSTAMPSPSPVNLVPCTPRADWTLYTVVSGDTLGGIAVRTASSVADLLQANCLTSPDLLRVG